MSMTVCSDHRIRSSAGRMTAGILAAVVMLLVTAFPALAHTADGVAYQAVDGTQIRYTSGVTQEQLSKAVSEYAMLPDAVRNKLIRHDVLIYLYPSSMEADNVDGSFVGVTHSGVWVWQGTMLVSNLTPPWIDIHADRAGSGTLIHEAGHAMDHLYEPGVTAAASRAEEFRQLYKTYRSQLAAVDRSAALNTYRIEEAYAECFRLALTDPNALAAVSGEMLAYVRRTAELDSGNSWTASGSGADTGTGSGGSGGSGSGSGGGISTDSYGWIHDSRGWWYRFDDGSWPAGEWLETGGNWYYFDSDGYMATGWRQWNNKYYYLDDVSGAMLHDCRTPDGFYVGPDGALISQVAY